MFLRIQTLEDGVEVDKRLYAMHTDHLGSTAVLSYLDPAAGTAAILPDSRALYEPFGEYRLEPTGEYTDRGYTGHLGNNSGSNDIGLIYMNARYYVPNTNRWLSPDTIVPNPTNPQSFNRYSYVLNNPIGFIDPTGHFEQDAIYDYLLGACGGYAHCADHFYGQWSQDGEWWEMLLEAQAGDVLFGTFHAGPNDGFVHFRFDGQGRDVLSGITFTDADGNYVASNLNGATLLDIFNGGSKVNYHGSNPSFEWGGLFRHTSQGGMPSTPYIRNRSESYFTSEQVTWDNRIKGVAGSIVGGVITYRICGEACGVIVGAFTGQTAGEIMFYNWDEYGRQINDRYWNVGSYELTYRLSPDQGYTLIYYSGLNQSTPTIPYWIR